MDWKDMLQELVSLVKSVAPELWEIVLRQVYVETIQFLVWVIILAVFAAFLFRLGKHYQGKSQKQREANAGKAWYEKDDDNWWFSAMLSYLGSVVAIVVSLILVNAIIGRLINPKFYALSRLIEYVK